MYVSPEEVVARDPTIAPANSHIVALLVSAWLALLADSPLEGQKRKQDKALKPYRTYSTFRNRLLADIKSSVLSLSSLADRLVRSDDLVDHGSHTTNTGPWIPEFSDTPIFKEYHEWYQTGDIRLMRYILSFLQFGKKLDYEDDEFHATALRQWLDVEEHLADLDFDPHILDVLKDIVDVILPDVTDAPVLPSFGNGSVSERGVRGPYSKIEKFAYDPVLDYAFFRSSFSRGREERYSQGFDPDFLIPNKESWVPTSRVVSKREARVAFVPKDLRKSRSICMEPNVSMFFQQAYRRLLEHSIASGPLRAHVVLRDQEVNQLGCQIGSLTGHLDTIDLSSASDSVSVDLVKGIFPRRMLFYLLATRTRHAKLPNGEVRELKKFAPMGSALCFPVQCAVYSAVVILSALLSRRDLGLDDLAEHLTILKGDIRRFGPDMVKVLFNTHYAESDSKFEPFYVYGDDIICDFRITSTVVDLLKTLGFSVNIEKSFTGRSCYRESCGKHFHLGQDVTPILFRVKRFGKRLGPDTVQSLISTINRFGDEGFRTTRRLLLQFLMTADIKRVRKVRGVNPISFSRRRQFDDRVFTTRLSTINGHLPTRYFKPYQRDEMRILQLRTAGVKPDESVDADFYWRLSWWRSAYFRTKAPEFISGVQRWASRGNTRFGWGWAPVER